MGIRQDNKREMHVRLAVSLIFVVPLIVFYQKGHLDLTLFLIQLMLFAPIVVVNRRIFVNGFLKMRAKGPDADSLIALGAAASVLVLQICVAGVILTLSAFGEWVESKIAVRTGETLETLLHENEILDTHVSSLSEKVDRLFVPVVMGAAVVTFLLWAILDHNMLLAALAGISVLVVASPGCLELAAPAAFTVGVEKGRNNDIIIKRVKALEQAHKIETVVLDKTGTITVGKPDVTDIIPLDDTFDIFLAAAIEKYSEHPLAKAIQVEASRKPGLVITPEVFEETPGRGVKATIRGRTFIAGNQAFMENKGIEPDYEAGRELASLGKTVVYFAELEEHEGGRFLGGNLIGIIALRDGPRPTSLRAVSMLENLGIDVIMLTGDNADTAEAIRKEVGIDRAIAQVLPSEKDQVIAKIQDNGKLIVAMVGDGTTDAEAIAQADVGMAFVSNAEIDDFDADVVLFRDDLTYVARTIRLSRAVMSNIKQNLIWSICYNFVGILIAAGALFPLIGWLPGPMLSMLFMCLSPLLVMVNALRIKKARLYQK